MFFARKKLSLKKRGAKLETKKMKTADETGPDGGMKGGTKAHNQKRCPHKGRQGRQTLMRNIVMIEGEKGIHPRHMRDCEFPNPRI
ncbi:hypothetical protein DQG23_17320 [Paenibacillus contaminans]|uniref:Uncharacterized protein n=1 Tax=Paenibacillus contaminans TaxID=450362 RepID=A0A329MKR4_9BACL|nr:hypothetical protein DQG23_17320 [Paenibacillus contaminans]